MQSTASLKFVSQRQTCADRFTQVFYFKVLGMANLRLIMWEEEEDSSAEVVILLFYINKHKMCL